MSEPETYVVTRDLKAALTGRETEILDALNIDWRKCSRSHHLRCPYPEHGGDGLNWRWDAKQRKAHCSCQTGHADNALDVLLKVEGLDVEAGKIRAAEILGRPDLIKQKGKVGQRMDAASLLNPPAGSADAGLPAAYLGHRLGIEVADVLMPGTATAGWVALSYWDPPSQQGGKPVEVGQFPAATFATVAADGGTHAHRVYLAPARGGKADLGTGPNGHRRDPKKSAKASADGASTAGRSVLWGNVRKAHHAVVAEGIETAAAVAHAFRREIEAGTIVVAAAISAGGIAAWQPWPETRRVTIAADRDEARTVLKPEPSHAGEKAAREFGLRRHDEGSELDVRIALPGVSGKSVDWLDIHCTDGVAAVRAGIEAAVRFVPTAAELQDRADKAGREAELERVAAMFPLPALNGKDLFYAHTKAGRVWVHKTVTKGKGENAVSVDVAISSPFGVRAWLKMKDADDAFGLRLVVEGPRRQPKVIDIECGDLASMNGVEVRRLLLSSGMRFEEDGEAVAVALFKAANPEAEISVVRHPGWHTLDGRRVFVSPGGDVIGLPDGASLELATGVVLTGTDARRGSLDGWKAAVATAVAVDRCPHFTLGVVAGFAGVLIDLCGLDSCGVNLSGDTSKGKSTSQKLGASSWSATESGVGLFQAAKTTVNGFEALAARANATIFSLDEMAHLDAKETAKCIYTLASGVGKTRLTVNAAVREQRRWRTFAMLSNEMSLEAKIKAGGETWTGGMTVRVVDIGVEDVNSMVEASTMQAIERFSENYGWAGPAFVQGLVDEGFHERPDKVKHLIEAFGERLASHGADAPTKRAARPLAVLAVAGMLAQKYGLLPPGTATQDAVRWGWAKFTKSSEAVSLDPTALAVRNIRTWIAERWRTSLHGIHAEERPTRDAVGWWDDDAVYLTPDRLVEAAGGALKEQAVARALNAGGMLAKRKSDENLSVAWVPTVGKLKAYALSRKHFGRGSEVEAKDEDGFRVFTGGRP